MNTARAPGPLCGFSSHAAEWLRSTLDSGGLAALQMRGQKLHGAAGKQCPERKLLLATRLYEWAFGGCWLCRWA